MSLSKVRGVAWDCTVGAGLVGEDAPTSPARGALDALERALGRLPDAEEVEEFYTHWTKSLQEAQQP